MRALARGMVVAALASLATRTSGAQDTASFVARDTTPVPHRPHNTLPAVEILGFLTLNNLAARLMFPRDTENGIKVYSSTFKSTWDHLRQEHWVYDIDPFNTNQFGHPYQGASMYGFARSTGHNYLESLVYANAGEFVWKMAGETDPPSINDMITTAQAGSLLGEALYRMADLVLRDGDPAKPNLLHTVGSMLISNGINRRILGDQFAAKLPDTVTAFWQLRLGAMVDATTQDVSTPTGLTTHHDATAQFTMGYGLPGQAGYDYKRPFDYFDLEAGFLLSSIPNFIDDIMLRGLLIGTKTHGADNERGIWGLYGSYDYIAPYLFRVSSTALSLGTTRQYDFRPNLTLQASMLSGVGYGAAGTTAGFPATATNEARRDYHFGVTPQVLLAMKLIIGDRAAIDMTARDYYVTGVGSDDARGSEKIFRGNIGATLRLFGGRAVALQYVLTTRRAEYGAIPPRGMQEGTVTLVFTILGGKNFGRVAWQ